MGMDRVAMDGNRNVGAGVLTCPASEACHTGGSALSASAAKALIVTRTLIAALEALRHPKTNYWLRLTFCAGLSCTCLLAAQTGKADATTKSPLKILLHLQNSR